MWGKKSLEDNRAEENSNPKILALVVHYLL